MKRPAFLRLQGLVFALVAAAFTNIYLPQPVLPILASEFHVSAAGASMTISIAREKRVTCPLAYAIDPLAGRSRRPAQCSRGGIRAWP